MEEDEKYMWRCIQLAQNGGNATSPNPMVGAVIVYKGEIIGEGFHIHCGDWHAEVNAINSVKDETLLKHSTLYVTLEPCSHFGKTPPCADLIIKKQIPRIVIGCIDPSLKVHGRGIKKLTDAGCQVKVGVLEHECRHLIRHFTRYNMDKRPYIILKWAESSNGYISAKNQKTMISTSHSLMLMHKRRAESDAILVGTHTAVIDNPKLTVRDWYGKNPIRVVLDRNLVLPESLNLFDGAVPTLVFTTKRGVNKNNIEYIVVPEDDFNLSRLMDELVIHNIQSLLVEGGKELHQSFIDEDLWDEAFIEKSNLFIDDGVRAAQLNSCNLIEIRKFFGVSIFHYSHIES